jgi:hypothetical protein
MQKITKQNIADFMRVVIVAAAMAGTLWLLCFIDTIVK